MQFRNKCLAASATLALSAGAAFAGGVAPVVVEPAPVVVAPAAAAFDWSGFYVGASVGKLDSSATAKTAGGDVAIDLDGGTVPGIFAGYNWQTGNFVFGGEIAFGFPGDSVVTSIGGSPATLPGDGIGNVFDVFARGGYAFDRAMIYAKVGYSKTKYDAGSLGSMDFDGVAYGLGIDFAATDHIVVGLDWTKRDLDGDNQLAPTKVKLDASTVTLRVAYKF